MEDREQIEDFFKSCYGVESADALENLDGDDIHSYFDVFGESYWPDVADQGIELLSFLINDDVDDASASGIVIASVAQQAASGVIKMLAGITGLDVEALYIAITDFDEVENFNNRKCMELFLSEYKKAEDFLASLKETDGGN